MLRIKEILKEKGMGVADLADKLEVSRQALSRQMQGKLLVETAQRIADALEVPMWQLFASPSEVTSERDFIAFIKNGDKTYQAGSIAELKDIITKIEGSENCVC